MTDTQRDKVWAKEIEAVVAGAQDVARAPDGWKSVPVEPTTEILVSGSVAIGIEPLGNGGDGGYPITGKQSTIRQCYDAFLAAAPAAPAVAPVPTPQQISDYLHGLDRIQRELVEREARLLLPTAEPEPAKISAPDIILTGAQLIEALDFIAPDRDADQLESEVAFAYGEGHSGKAMYIWCAEYPEEGSLVCDGSSATAAPAQAEQQGDDGAKALTDDAMMGAIKSVCGFDADKAEKWRPEALAIGRAVERAIIARGVRPSARVELSDEQLCAVQYVEQALRAIAERREQIGDAIEPLNDIRAASRRAAYALKRFEPIARAILAASAAQTGESK